MGDLLLDAIVKYTLIVEKDLPKKMEQFARQKNWIVYDYTFTRLELFHEDGIDLNGEKYFQIICLLQIITSEFLDLYQKLITPPNGENKVSVHVQVDILVAQLVDTDVDELFNTKIGRCVYHIIGCL